MPHSSPAPTLWRITPAMVGGFLLLAAILCAAFFDALIRTWESWLAMEEYSHGVMIPFIAAFLVWQRKNLIAAQPFTGSWGGVAVAATGLLLLLLGELSTLYVIEQYAFVLTLGGAILAITGPRVFRVFLIPLLMLLFVVPLPNFLMFGLSAKLQLVSSWIGVAFLRLFDVSVYLEGNVIDLGTYKLQVVEACSGLRYLFPLMSVAFICAYFFQAVWWKRLIVFLSSIPITVLMNSFRIGAIGLTVDRWGPAMAEGFLHDFEGWAVFMVCTGLLLAEMWLLARFDGERRPFSEVFGITFPEPWPADTALQDRPLPRPYWAVLGLVGLALGISLGMQQRTEVTPARADFAEFPLRIDGWTGSRESIEEKYVDTLRFDDYLLANYTRAAGEGAVNLYAAYYSSQRKGASIHSPKTCLPGGGWDIQSSEVVTVPLGGGAGIPVNRVVIRRGEDSQLVYYWFRQRGRDITDEYLAKWYLFLDALTRNRTDGALLRLTTPVSGREDPAAADRRLAEFLTAAAPLLARFIAD